MKAQNWVAVLFVFVVSAAGTARADDPEAIPPEVSVVAVQAQPESISLNGKYTYRQIVLLGRSELGETVDVTRVAKLENAPKTVSVSPQGLVRPIANGQDEIVMRYGDHVVRIPCEVTNVEENPQISFVRDVQPAMSRMGCNAGTCHGAKEGKNGFKLSLRGYDPLYDHRALTDDIAARRFNRAAPDQSLFLLKASGSIPHVGGVRTRVGEPYYEIMRAWITQGSKLDMDAPRVASIDVAPKNPVVPRPNMKQQMTVMATYTDGTVRDVTQEAFIESGNVEVIAAEPGGVVKMLRRGEAPVLVRFEGAYAATTLTVMGDRTGFAWTNPPSYNYVDDLVYSKLQRMKILPSELCSDEEFVRRAYLDLTGLPPTSDAVRQFTADPRPSREKRDLLIDSLIGSPAYVEYWTNKWADLLQVNRKFLGEEGAVALRNWIKGAVSSNLPYNKFAEEILTASGSTIENPPAAYYKVLRSPDALMENTTHLFLAIRFNCNKCHDHPFERWTQDQYYHLSAYFAQIGMKEDPRFSGQTIGGSAVEGATPLVEVVFDKNDGEVTHLRTGQTAAPSFPFSFGVNPDAGLPRREQLSAWLTSAENPYFAKSYVNRLWGYLLGAGIISPIDDIRAGNPATNPELLDALTKEFISSGFDMQHMLRTICKSRTYQLSVASNQWNEDDKINYSHCIPRRLPAEVLFDSIHVTTGATPQIEGVPAGFRAAELPDAGVSNPFLDDFGRPPRESACECERSSGVVLGPIMKLINGPTISDALSRPDNALTKLVATEPDDQKVIDEVFLRFLARHPTEEERKLALDAFQQAGAEFTAITTAFSEYQAELDKRQAEWEQRLGQGVVWTPLTATEFKSEVGAQFQVQPDGSVLVTGNNGKDIYTVGATTTLQGITAIRLEALPDASLPAGGPGRAGNGNFVINELRLTAGPQSDASQAKTIALSSASADFSQDGFDVTAAIDGNPSTGWAVMPAFNQPHTAIFETAEDIAGEGEIRLTLQLDHQYPDNMHTLGKFRLSVTSAKRPVQFQRLPDNIQAILATAAEQRTDAQRAELAQYYRSQDADWARMNESVKQAEQLLKDRRLVGVQDLAWALINTPSFLFNR